MKTDRELLELAAKAAGLEFKWRDGDQKWGPEHVGPAAFIAGCWQSWNPLTDDGDALRLAVRLDLLQKQDFWRERSVQYAMEAFSGDRQCPYAATRRAIVLAAASIGELLP